MTWDGEERRQVKWDDIVGHMAKTNEKWDANTNALKELAEKIKIQNGRIGKLENWRAYVVGGFAVMLFIINYAKH